MIKYGIQDRSKFTIPKPELLRPNKGYAFTINPETQYFDDTERLPKVIRHIKTILNTDTIAYKLYIEVSSLGRIHAHGYIWVKDPKQFYLTTVPYLCSKSTFDIEEITDDEGWEHYIQKQIPLMLCKPIFKDYPPQFTSVVSDIGTFYDI